MAATALDVLSLAAAKAELQVEDTDAFDARIEAEIGAAVDFVSRELGRPLLDLTEVSRASPSRRRRHLPDPFRRDRRGEHRQYRLLDGLGLAPIQS